MKIPSVAAFGTMGALLFAACAPPESTDTAETPAPEPVRESAVLTQAAQQALTPDDVLRQLKEGNRRFVEDRMIPRDYMAQAAATAGGQYPKAVILSCLDSRVPPEIVFDQGIGDLFVGRVAGNFENTDMLGSLEFATKAAGSKAIVVLGHTQCGAIKGAVAGVDMGNLTAMLENFDEVVARARAYLEGMEAAGVDTDALVTRAIEENVRQTVADILSYSPVISEQVDNGEVVVVGGVYDLATGEVTWLDS
jgi:carbonic anhydrase